MLQRAMRERSCGASSCSVRKIWAHLEWSFRTSDLVLVVEAGVWKLAGFTAVDGPTPIATDSLPADWDSFAVVAGWQPASGGEG